MMRSEKGASAVEFALIAPLLFILTFGIIEFAVLLFDKAVVTNASREGARAAIVYNTTVDDPPVYTPLTVADIQAVVTDYANGYLINLGGENNIVSTDIVPEYSDDSNGPWDSGPPVSGGYVRVTVPYTYTFLVLRPLISLIGGDFKDGIPLVGTTVMRME